MQHQADPAKNYPELSLIKDDNNDGIIEVNRPEEIDALLISVKNYLTNTGFPLDGKRLVWVSDNKAFYSSKESHDLPREEHEATAYASVYKFSHDIAPAKAALGSGGCTDCHRDGSPFFEGKVLKEIFSAQDGKPRWAPNYEILGIAGPWIKLGTFREASVKPVLYILGRTPYHTCRYFVLAATCSQKWCPFTSESKTIRLGYSGHRNYLMADSSTFSGASGIYDSEQVQP